MLANTYAIYPEYTKKSENLVRVQTAQTIDKRYEQKLCQRIYTNGK